MEPIIGKAAAEHWENCWIGYLPEDKNSKFSSLLWKIIVTRKYLAEWMTVEIIQKTETLESFIDLETVCQQNTETSHL